MSHAEIFAEENRRVMERFELVRDRIKLIGTEGEVAEKYRKYFERTASFICDAVFAYEKIEDGFAENASEEEQKNVHNMLFADIVGDAYESSFVNPRYAVRELGEEFGGILSMLAAELRGLIPYAYEKRLNNMTILMELFVEIYNSFLDDDISVAEVSKIIYYFFYDYAEVFTEHSVKNMICPEYDFFTDIIENSELTTTKYLYRYGSYIGENELGISRYLASLDEEKIKLMADTFTEGYIKGFQVTNKPLEKKKTCMIYYPIGFERVIKRAIENLRAEGLKPCIFREKISSCEGTSGAKSGAYSTSPNRQLDFDHQNDMAYYFDKSYALRKNELRQYIYVKNREQAALQAGPAVMEVFGETGFMPESKKERKDFDRKQRELYVEYVGEGSRITNEYIIGSERSYTIIAFPIPEIGKDFEKIFEDTIRLNTLDYEKYKDIQQRIIDVLDKGECVHIKGSGENRTDLTVSLFKLNDPERETIFENCVADVNIPVGEVFTSPVLKGTTGILNVSGVFLNGLYYRDLEVEFKDGMIVGYSCKNFEDDAENQRYIKENILKNHDTLTIGEFAIGTNTVAYKMARDYHIEALMPILIAEKTGPHFAVGDTCYSHCEDTKVYNPNGKEIVARDNEHTLIRKSEPLRAYYNCHTDITIPYDELSHITVHTRDKKQYDIIRDGMFVVEGSEELNEPLKQMK